MARRWIGVWALVVAAKLAVAGTLGVLADEAYHWVWSLRPALGYYDQPPLVAWILAVTSPATQPSALALRWGPVLLATVGVGGLVMRCTDRWLALVWMVGLPPLFVLTELAVPDALLIGGWALALTGALAGGSGLVVAGIGAGLAGLAKPTAWGLLPLIVAALSPEERRSPWLFLGVVANVLLLVPFGLWLVANDGVTLAFQFGENILDAPSPGAVGVVRQLGDQAAFVTPFAFLAGLAFVVQPPGDRMARIAWLTSVPVLAGFAGAAWLGPPEAHWPAPAWLGIGIGLSAASGWRHRLAWVGALTAAALSLLLLVHLHRPLVRLTVDPAVRTRAGAVLAAGIARWALAEGAASATEGHTPVYTERYQEAALVHFHTGIPAVVLPGCGRRSQYDLWPPRDGRPEGWFVRPARSGVPRCAGAHFGQVVEVQGISDIDAYGREVGPWDLWRVTP